MEKELTSTRPESDSTVLDACWAHYTETAVPQHLTGEALTFAQAAFHGGARALYEVLIRLQALADQRGDGPLDLTRVGRVLGLEDSPDLNG